ncbi:MAG: hypothetical protein BGN87_21810 [Rhizobiales bacterium 65-79]|jgi:hypothetical protein|nr:hypothetical protein [Hyphomicrobiales bacterium]OJU04144.1 MAG: hypothetical protein BGN87_21810 [Rhizobiales bacterium 65-79]
MRPPRPGPTLVSRSPTGDNRRRNAGPHKKRAIGPVEGAQTGPEGLGYLEKPAEDQGKSGSGRGK